jgi:hypothetical protein
MTTRYGSWRSTNAIYEFESHRTLLDTTLCEKNVGEYQHVGVYLRNTPDSFNETGIH